mgnify:CR=1 FL=1
MAAQKEQPVTHHRPTRAARDKRIHSDDFRNVAPQQSFLTEPIRTKKEVAEILGIHRETVRTIELKALAKMREGLAGDPVIGRWLADRGIDAEDLLDGEGDV